MSVEIGEKLKALRIKKNMTQKELAAYLHISFQSVSKWESGKSLPSLDRVVELSQLYNISIDELLGVKKRSGILGLLDKMKWKRGREMAVEIGERLKELRIKKGFTEQELADYLHISFQSVSKWESGKSLPSLDRVAELSQLYNVSPDELIAEKRRSGLLGLLDKMNDNLAEELGEGDLMIVLKDPHIEISVADYPHLPELGNWTKTSGSLLRVVSGRSGEEIKRVFCEDTGFDEEEVTVRGRDELYWL